MTSANFGHEIRPMSVERILVVDDEEAIREVVCSMLRYASYPCVQAHSGLEALSILRDDPDFQLILTDMMMPELDGMGLLDVVRTKYEDLPVVMVTAVHDISVALSAIRHGAYDYLLKPFEREQLMAVVGRALETNRLRVQNRIHQSNLEALVDQRTAELRETIAELERSYDVTLEALGGALDLKDAETQGHSRRVTSYAIEIARAIGFAPEKMPVLARGAFLHDIGKMAVPDAILRKPFPLNDQEQELMRGHSYQGYQMLKRIPFLNESAEIVYAHQERWDGSGYPRGLKGEEIPLGARVFAIADALDAITSDRPYRQAQSFDAARDEIDAWSGRQFDPRIVRGFLTIPASVWERKRAEIDSQQEHFCYSGHLSQAKTV
ncbi:MAG TPA: HD domain-containing phosphohydrolase [Candidatus Saccharimonadales bacterium]|nr:HD domain-containing phosphohydrolase [Candidatus Saccharimonadales bacterium]